MAVLAIAMLGLFPVGASASVDPVPPPEFGTAQLAADTWTDAAEFNRPDLGPSGNGEIPPAEALSKTAAAAGPATSTATDGPTLPTFSEAQGFDAGNIIADAVFDDYRSMDDGQLADFLATRGAACIGAFCLSHLMVDSVDQPADDFCTAYAGGHNEAAATVIGKVSRSCGINPQVMVATLQKESGLVDSPGPSAASYDAAWGWHCPDTGPGGEANCDPAFAGFFNQLYGMAKQWARYRVTPDNYRYHAGETVQILWNVAESGCGSAPVTIANRATASLYNYTPYQPNPASLAAYPGVGDACSSYGNRNFFFLFRRYFGSTGGGGPVGVAAVTELEQTPLVIPAGPFVSAGAAGRTIIAPTAAVAAGLRAGFSSLGLPYVWGGGGSGAGPDNGCARGRGQFNSCAAAIGFDCSGLTGYVLGQAGFAIPGDSASQRHSGVRIEWDRALPGDIVGFPGHVAVYLGRIGPDPYILEASWVGSPVHVVPLTRDDHDPVVYRYWAGAAQSAAGRSQGSVFAATVQTFGALHPVTPTVPRTFNPSIGPVNTLAAVAGSGPSVPISTTTPSRPVPTASEPTATASTTGTSAMTAPGTTAATTTSIPPTAPTSGALASGAPPQSAEPSPTTATAVTPGRPGPAPPPTVDMCVPTAAPGSAVGGVTSTVTATTLSSGPAPSVGPLALPSGPQVATASSSPAGDSTTAAAPTTLPAATPGTQSVTATAAVPAVPCQFVSAGVGS